MCVGDVEGGLCAVGVWVDERGKMWVGWLEVSVLRYDGENG